MHKITMTELEHEEAIKFEATEHHSYDAMAESTHELMKSEMLNFCAEADSAKDSMRKHSLQLSSESQVLMKSRRLSSELRIARQECEELHQELRDAHTADPKPMATPPVHIPPSAEAVFVTPGMQSVHEALERVRADNIARLAAPLSSPPGLVVVLRAAGPSEANLHASISRYLAPVPPSAKAGSSAAVPDPVSRASRAADRVSRASRAADQTSRASRAAGHSDRSTGATGRSS
jgi:hypothetical protein